MRPRRFRTERVVNEHRKRVRLEAVLYVVLGVCIIVLGFAFSWSPFFEVNRILITGKSAIPKESLFHIAEQNLTGHTFLFSKQNITFLPKKQIASDLQAAFPRLGSVEIDRDGLHRIIIVVADRTANGMWCPLVGMQTEMNCYFIDETGFAFDEAPRITGEAFMVYRREMPNEPLARRITGTPEFQALDALVAELRGLRISVSNVVWRDDAIVFSGRYTTQKVSGDVMLLLPLYPPYDSALQNLLSLLESSDVEYVERVMTTSEYIDLRFEDRIFYKAK